MLRQNGPVMVTEATDDRGRSLVAIAPAKFDLGPADRFQQSRNEGGAIQVDAVLAAQNPPATVIRRLRGKVPVVAIASGSDPMVIPLKGEGVLGRPYSTRDLTLIVNEVSQAPGAPARVKVTVRANRGDRASFATYDPPGSSFGYNIGGVLDHLELRDASGRRLNHHVGSQTRARALRPLRVDGLARPRGRSCRRSEGLEGSRPLRAALCPIRREGDGNPLRFPRHPDTLNWAGVLPMSIALLVLFAAMAAAPAEGPDPTALVAKLGSAEPAERAAATESLKALGRVALPALQRAMKADNADVCERASALWDTIQRDLMTRPSLVRLEGRDRPLSTVLGDLERQTGLELRNNSSIPDRLVALREPAPVSFWTASSGSVLGEFPINTREKAGSRRSTSATHPRRRSCQPPAHSGSP